MPAEQKRMDEAGSRWREWGPYVSERAWGTVREDYSSGGTPWEYFPHDHARSRAYRWGEDGIAGICDRRQFLCFAVAMWNGRDPILKERLFGLTGNEGRHGEDAKEYWFHLDSTPTHSYMKYLYRYPQAAYPYQALIDGNARRTRDEPEFELSDTGVLEGGRFFDVTVEYAKAGTRDLLIRITVANRGGEAAELDLLPTLWFRNTWAWGWDVRRPRLWQEDGEIGAAHYELGDYRLTFEGAPEVLFTGNETNFQRLYGVANPEKFVKDGIDRYVVHGEREAVNPEGYGTKAALRYRLRVAGGASETVRLRLRAGSGAAFDEAVMAERLREADEYYAAVAPAELGEDGRQVLRRAIGGLLWNKQFYAYEVRRWLQGDPANPEPPVSHRKGRNRGWGHLRTGDVLSMPDKWEYPWFAAWDLAFHTVTLALVDPAFAKRQLLLLLRERYMHPNGQLPAYEWNFNDVNPPVHAWAAWRVYKLEQERFGRRDRGFLERVFHKLMLNFTWWVNRHDAEGNNVFQGGFLGFDNIGVLDRSAVIPGSGSIEQSDGTSWMGMYCLNMMTMALELARENPAYEDVASKFLEHFVYISFAMKNISGEGISLWDRQDEFYFDVLRLPDGHTVPMRVRSLVGLTPLFAVETIDSELIDKLPGFKRRLQWFIDNEDGFSEQIETLTTETSIRRFLSLVGRPRLRRVLGVMLDEAEFLSPYGIRSLSRRHGAEPYILHLAGADYRVGYEPSESRTGLFGGNSNWRGPVWFPVNFLLIESLRKLHDFLGDRYQVECPTGSGKRMDLRGVSDEIARRLMGLFLRRADGRRAIYGDEERWRTDPNWRDLILFHEFFDGETGRGLGASHQTGWTALVANLLVETKGV